MSDSLRATLVDALTATAAAAYPNLDALARGALEEVTALGGDAAAKAKVAAEGIAVTVKDVAAGRLSYDVGQELVSRYLAALDETRLGAQEAAARVAIQRARKGLEILKDAGMALAKVAVTTALGSL